MFRLTKQELARMIDHTLLRPEAVSGDIVKLCEEAVENLFGAVCVNPAYVPPAVRELEGTNVRVGTVIGFPLGATNTAGKVAEAGRAVSDGAAEFDVVINIGALKDRETAYLEREFGDVIGIIRKARPDAVVKVILETALLTDAEKVLGCRLAADCGADMVKTSTGFGPGGATEDDVRLLRSVVGDRLGVKAAGGIRDLETALQMIAAGASRIGTSSGVKIMQEWSEAKAMV
ncbi:MAG: deoxyribose-phosphate aldolase [Ammonifex sp.]|jgi:deoxyribose-phosphate aldolase|nr:MAG: deoxyribose-phosphate aldolase [Ammonifex sp.]